MVKGLEDKIFNLFSYAVMASVGLICLFPLLYVVSVSLTPIEQVLRHGGFILIPQQITFAAYKHLLTESSIPQAFYITLFVTVVGTAANLLLTLLMGYPLSRKKLPLRTPLLFLVMFTMLFNGGIIPTYFIVKAMGLLNTVWAMIIPGAVSTFNLLIVKTFFENLPEELFESARMDGAREWQLLSRIVIPLSLPALLTVGLFYAVGHWNTFLSAIMYISNRELHPLQVVVRGILMQSQQPLDIVETAIPTTTLQMAAVVLASLPIILVYPFLQKHFVKGVMIGSIKG